MSRNPERHITASMVDFIVATGYDDIPAEAIDATESVLLDTVGAAAAGLATDAGQRLARFKIAQGRPDSTLFGHGVRLPAAGCRLLRWRACTPTRLTSSTWRKLCITRRTWRARR